MQGLSALRDLRTDWVMSAEDMSLLMKLLTVLNGGDVVFDLEAHGGCNICQKAFRWNPTTEAEEAAIEKEDAEHVIACWLGKLKEIQARPDYESILCLVELVFDEQPH